MESQQQNDSESTWRAGPGLVAAWFVVLLATWSLTWFLYAKWEGKTIPVETHGLTATLWWTGAKVLVWLVPVVVLARRIEGADVLKHFGLSEARGLGFGALASAAWLAVLLAECALTRQVPRLGRDPAGVLSACIAAPFLEETVFRGFALRTLRRCGLRFWRANLISALLFTALHIPGWIFMRGMDRAILIDCCSVGFFGLVLGAVAWRSPSLWAPILVHAANNAWSQGVFSWIVSSLTQ